MKTALQELIEWMEEQYYPAMYEDAIDKATELLETEREQIIVAHANGIHDVSNCLNGEPFKTSEGYYKDTYK